MPIRAPQLKSIVKDLVQSGPVDRAGLNTALDAALRDGTINTVERKALDQLLVANSFDGAPSKQRLQAFLAMPDDDLRALAYKLERDDGSIQLKDARALTALVERGGVNEGERVSLQALMLGVKMTGPARKSIKNLVSGDAPVVQTIKAKAITPKTQRRLDAKALRTYTLSGAAGPQLVDRRKLDALAPPPAGQLHQIDGDQLSKALDKAIETRQAKLATLGGAVDTTTRVCPEDGSLRVRNMHMAMLGMDQSGAVFPKQMAQIGKLEGFNVILRAEPDRVDKLQNKFKQQGLDNVKLVGAAGEGDFWSEDQGELDTAGNVRVPAPRSQDQNLFVPVLQERIRRLYPEATALPDTQDALLSVLRSDYPDAAYAMVGAVAERGSHEVLAGVALAKGTEIKACLSHLEGGNLLVGTLPGGEAYALVGSDSFAATRSVLEQDLGRPISDAEVRQAIGVDLGVQPAHVHSIEQPRDFHLDMWMTPIKPGEVLVDDAMQSAELLIQINEANHLADKPKAPRANASEDSKQDYQSSLKWWKDLGGNLKAQAKQIRSIAKRRASFQKKMCADLEQAGMKIHSVPGVLESNGSMVANFLNAEQGVNSKGERYYIALGADPMAEKSFVGHLAKIAGAEIARVHLMDRDFTRTTLSAQGGISCRTKAEGDVLV